MRKFLIDTDTASDDAIALMMALREPTIQVEAITVVCGNLSVDQAVKNALNTIEAINTYAPPVYRGMHKPIMRPLFTSEYVHGSDGMGNMHLPAPTGKAEDMHAIDAIIHHIMANPHELEVVTLGPMTNLALAYLKEPRIAEYVKRVIVMGGQGLGPGNVTPVAEFNFYVDAEAVEIVLQSGMPLTFVGWDVSMDKTFIDEGDIERIAALQTPLSDFTLSCTKVLQEHNLSQYGRRGFDLPDPTAMAVAIWPDMVRAEFETYGYMETKSEQTYGQLIIDRFHVHQKPANVTICQEIDADRFKQKLLELLS
ncbi:UNVERIFIED_CONTAM: purine nucleosidase [Brevibacillus sp. OAP136]